MSSTLGVDPPLRAGGRAEGKAAVTPVCSVCHTRLDPVWADMGYTVHVNCDGSLECAHGEVRGPRYCAICRRSNTAIVPPEREDKRPPVERNVVAVGLAHPITSHQAAMKTLPSTGTKRRMVLDAIRDSGDGLCDWQLEKTFGWKHESASACRRSLVTDGWLCDSGRTRPVPDTGNPATVWVLEGHL